MSSSSLSSSSNMQVQELWDGIRVTPLKCCGMTRADHRGMCTWVAASQPPASRDNNNGRSTGDDSSRSTIPRRQ
jgi:hypothetical protein